MASISNISDVTTERTNTVGVLTPILEIDPEDGTSIVLINAVERGQQSAGIPIIADLRDGANDPLPEDTRVAVEFERPNDDNPTVVSIPFEDIRPYNTLSISDQQNEEYIDRIKHRLKGSALEIEDVDSAYISIESSAQIDWANSQLQVVPEAVEEV